ncbi:DUF7151 family protein [Corallococcus llansteffanensis]|uniref:DUF7151 domain-containing protein n=1 Tax=Corallococcus llansteffanensis TaxID=2316731 RepID=A0A3A8NXD6_9BACT|nr:leucine-rich repeat domain-containing protein [Corallococcus llansteffanensis]RKH49036.1 hypothetical protein D7V93_32455 [Corallococcus llansteffanensis]
MRRTWVTWGSLLALTVSGCDAIDLTEITQREARTRVRPEPAGEHCAHGGQAFLSGLDQDRDGVLDDFEVSATDYVCTELIPKVRTRTQVEPKGTNCTHGGQAVQSGLDYDGNEQLDDSEVKSTEYVCVTTVANVLVIVRPVASGEQCPRGGQVTYAGHDANGNELLEDEEITHTVQVCNEPAPVLSRARELPGSVAPCARGGSVVEAGADLDLDGVLDAAEIDATAYACDVAPAHLRLQHYQPEPGGMNCAAGGTGVAVFEDKNGDTGPDPGGFMTILHVCEAARIHDGDFVVASAVDLIALEGVDRLRGDLRIEAPTLAEAFLPTLAIIDGSLVVQGNSSLKRLALTSLRFVGGNVELRDNAQLEDLVLGDESQRLLRVVGSLTVEENAKLSSLEGLAAVVPTDSITLRSNNAMVAPGLLAHVVTLTGSLTLQDNLRLNRIPFINLSQVHGDMRFLNNSGLLAPSGLEQLVSVDGTLELRNNAQLETLAPLERLASLGALELIGNTRLPDTSGLLSLTRAGRIHIQGNAALVSVGDMPVLDSVDEEFSVKYNASLQRVHGMPLLRTAGGVAVVVNGALTSLNGFARLPQLGTLEVLGNPKLPTLGDFTALRELELLNVQGNPVLTNFGLGELARVTHDFTVLDNAKLPTCRATALAASVFPGTPIIDRNDDAATCP